jgi:hypothetical protein
VSYLGFKFVAHVKVKTELRYFIIQKEIFFFLIAYVISQIYFLKISNYFLGLGKQKRRNDNVLQRRWSRVSKRYMRCRHRSGKKSTLG